MEEIIIKAVIYGHRYPNYKEKDEGGNDEG